jgi:hypothetical protein
MDPAGGPIQAPRREPGDDPGRFGIDVARIEVPVGEREQDELLHPIAVDSVVQVAAPDRVKLHAELERRRPEAQVVCNVLYGAIPLKQRVLMRGQVRIHDAHAHAAHTEGDAYRPLVGSDAEDAGRCEASLNGP